MVDAIVDNHDTVGTGSRPDELGFDRLRNGDDARETRQQPLFDRVIELFVPAVTGEPMRGGQRDDRLVSRERPGEQIRLVIVRVDDVDLARPDELRNAGQIDGSNELRSMISS